MLFLPDFDDSQIEEELLADISDDSPFPTLDWGDFESLCTGDQEEKDQTPKTIKMEQQDISNYESLPKQENSKETLKTYLLCCPLFLFPCAC